VSLGLAAADQPSSSIRSVLPGRGQDLRASRSRAATSGTHAAPERCSVKGEGRARGEGRQRRRDVPRAPAFNSRRLGNTPELLVTSKRRRVIRSRRLQTCRSGLMGRRQHRPYSLGDNPTDRASCRRKPAARCTTARCWNCTRLPEQPKSEAIAPLASLE
jgi:hypothetical protein